MDYAYFVKSRVVATQIPRVESVPLIIIATDPWLSECFAVLVGPLISFYSGSLVKDYSVSVNVC